MTLSHISLETRLTKTDSSHVQEYVWLFAKQSINWQLCIGGVNSEIEITHTYFSNGQNISTLQMYSKILVRLHSSLHIYQITFSDIFTSMYLVASSNYTRTKKYTQYPHSLKLFSSGWYHKYFSHTQYYTHLFQEGMLPFREFTFSCWAAGQMINLETLLFDTSSQISAVNIQQQRYISTKIVPAWKQLRTIHHNVVICFPSLLHIEFNLFPGSL